MKSRMPVWVLVLFVALLATGTDELVIAGVLPAVATDLDVSIGVAGQLITVFAVAYALGAPLLSVLTDRFGRRNVLVVGLLVFAVANAGAALAPGYPTLLAARVAAALAAGAVTSAAFATAAAGAPEGRQGRVLSVVTAGMTVALFTGVPVGAWIAGAHGWRATFWLLAALSVGVAVGVWATAPGIPGGEPATLGARLAPLRSLPVARLVGATFLCGSGGLMFYSYLGPLTAELADDSYQALSLILLVVGVAGIGGVVLGGRTTDSWGPRNARRFVIAGHGVALLALAVLALSGVRNALAFAGLVAAWSVFAWALNPPLQASMFAAAPQAGMTAMALVISGMYLGTGVAAGVGGLIIELVGVEYIPLAGGVLLFLALALASTRDRPAPVAGPQVPPEPAVVDGRGAGEPRMQTDG